jgi:hypothetical protein
MGQVEILRVAHSEIDVEAQRDSPSPRHREHLGTEIDTGELYSTTVMGKVRSGADPEFECPSLSLRAEHPATVAERQSVETTKPTVIGTGSLVVVAPDAFGLADGIVRFSHRFISLVVPVHGLATTAPRRRAPASLSLLTAASARENSLGRIGSRVASLAGAGEVLVSRTVADLLAGSEINFHEHGEHELKGVPGTWRLFSVPD